MGPISGLLVQAMEECAPRRDLALARVSFDILGVIHLEEVTVRTEVARPGRTIELVDATLTERDRVVVRAHGWRLLSSDTGSIAGTELSPMAGPEQATEWDGSDTWAGGFIASLEIRVLPGWRPGRGRVWIRPGVPLFENAQVSELARIFGMVDTMNGVAIRPPAGEWPGLDAEVSFGAGGIGMTSAVLHDTSGPFGRALQILTLRPVA
jgi:hypothetical protein